jgi:hypothetical protein
VESNPYSSPFAAAGAPSSQVSPPSLDAVMPLYRVRGWLKFLGILNIIAGSLYCITIIGAIIGWLPLWIGILLHKAAQSLQGGVESGNAYQAAEGTQKLATVILIMGVLAAINVAIIVLYFAFIAVMIVVGAAMHM